MEFLFIGWSGLIAMWIWSVLDDIKIELRYRNRLLEKKNKQKSNK